MSQPTPKSKPKRGEAKYGRGRMSSDPMALRAPGRSAHSRRIRELFAGYMMRLPDTIVAQAAALRVAELVAAAEDIRVRILAGDYGLANDLVRIENLADRADRRLAKMAGEASELDEDEQWREQVRAAERRAAVPLTPEEQAREDALDPVKIYAKQKREREAKQRGEVT